MTDIQTIQELERILEMDLPELKEITWRSRGYTTNTAGQVLDFSLLKEVSYGI